MLEGEQVESHQIMAVRATLSARVAAEQIHAFVRGQDEDNTADIDLNQRGRIRAAALAALLWPAPVLCNCWAKKPLAVCQSPLTASRGWLRAGYISKRLCSTIARLLALQHPYRPCRCLCRFSCSLIPLIPVPTPVPVPADDDSAAASAQRLQRNRGS